MAATKNLEPSRIKQGIMDLQGTTDDGSTNVLVIKNNTGTIVGYVDTLGRLILSDDVSINGSTLTDLYLVKSGIGTTTTVLHGNAGGALTFSTVVEADITLAAGSSTNDTQVGTHGFAPALSGVDTQFLRGDGAWALPAGTTVPNAYAEESFSYTSGAAHVITHNFGARPLVQVIDSTGVLVAPTTIHHASVDEVEITMGSSATFDVILTMGSPPLTAYVSTAANYAMLAGDTLIEVTAADKIVTLLTPVGRVGKQVIVKNSSAGICDVQTAAGLIEGVADVTIPSTNAYTFVSNNVNWLAI
jgi:hypothetical protein